MDCLGPTLDEVAAALMGLKDLRNRHADLLRLNAPVSAASPALPIVVPD